jgi:putative methionine-R-sulfoxide reductase with GAF domain
MEQANKANNYDAMRSHAVAMTSENQRLKRAMKEALAILKEALREK